MVTTSTAEPTTVPSTLRATLAVGLLAVAGCVGPDLDYGEIAELDLDRVSSAGYRVEPGDQIRVVFAYHPARSRTVSVRPDGRLSIPFAEEVPAAGLTLAELDDELTARVGGNLESPDLSVLVHAHARQLVYVGGQVGRPGRLPLTPGMTIHQAVAAAGSLLPGGAADSVVLVREAGAATRVAVKLDLSEESLIAADFELRPFDFIYVPRTSIARLGVWIEQHISEVLPRGVRIIALRFHAGINAYHDL